MNYKELSLDEAVRWVRKEKRKWQTVRLINPDEKREILISPEGFRYGDFCQRKGGNGCDACQNFCACHMEEKVHARIRLPALMPWAHRSLQRMRAPMHILL